MPFEWSPNGPYEPAVDETRCRASVHPPGRGCRSQQCSRKPLPGSKWCRQHTEGALRASKAPEPAWFAHVDEHGKVVVEKITVRWEKEGRLMLEHRPGSDGVFSSKIRRVEYVPRSKEAALRNLICEVATERTADKERIVALDLAEEKIHKMLGGK
jgi:hypothetical protein